MTRVGQLLRFVLTGGTSTLVDLIVLRLLLLAGLDAFTAVGSAFLAGVGVNLLMHKFFTFRDGSPLSAVQVARYLAVVAINLAMTEAVVWAAVSVLAWTPMAGKLLSLPAVLAVGFTLARSWVFAAPRGQAGGRP